MKNDTPLPKPLSTEPPSNPKEISWLAFNERVLQEAENPDVPLIERLRYLGIFSNNMDEFFRVKIANLKRLINFSTGKKQEENDKLYKKIKKRIIKLQKRFDTTYVTIIQELRNQQIYLIDEAQVQEQQIPFIKEYFFTEILPSLKPVLFSDSSIKIPSLSDGSFYLAITLLLENEKTLYAVVEVPSPPLPRFVIIPSASGGREKVIMVLENIIRLCMKDMFQGTLAIKAAKAYAFKLTRDAEIELNDSISQNLLDKMTSSLKKRKQGMPVRFVYDKEMEAGLLTFLTKQLGFGRYDSIIAGERYHNFKDFMKFPNLGPASLEYPKFPATKILLLEQEKLIFDAIKQKDILLYFPYHSFSYIERLLHTAALDPQVRSIKITLYRLANNSHIIKALIHAVNNQKEVTVIVELQARFDEQANIHWAQELTEAGATVIFGSPGIKVHCKLILIKRVEGTTTRNYSYIGSGNFNENTSKFYTDISLLTYQQEIGQEIENIFALIKQPYRQFKFKHLLVSPHGFRPRINELIDREIAHALAGLPAGITLKCNNLVDDEIINKLYSASNSGVKIRLIVRGMISLVAGQKSFSENIEAISIVDRYLEHARIYIFENAGIPEFFFGSGDIMTRNLDYRVEVIAPVYDESIKYFLKNVIDLQWSDNVKARVIDKKLTNKINTGKKKKKNVRSQFEIIKLVENTFNPKTSIDETTKNPVS